MTSPIDELLRILRGDDGGFGPSADVPSEPEPTALAAVALDDSAALQWLTKQQGEDGGWLTGPESVGNRSATALCALAITGDGRERALDHLVANRSPQAGPDDRIPHDPDTRGWGWTPSTFAWAEPTARAVLALKLHRPSAQEEIADGLAVLADRETDEGGWNYGNRVAFGVVLHPFLQTTAAGVMAVQDGPAELRERGVEVLRRLWREERGLLGWAMTLVAFRLCGVDEPELADGVRELAESSGVDAGTVALGWAALGLGDRWRQLSIGT